MGQAKLKAARRPEREGRRATVRLQTMKLEGQIVAYDDHGRAQTPGSGALEAIYLMEADIPLALVEIVRKRFPKLEFEFIDPEAEEPDGEKSKLVG